MIYPSLWHHLFRFPFVKTLIPMFLRHMMDFTPPRGSFMLSFKGELRSTLMKMTDQFLIRFLSFFQKMSCIPFNNLSKVRLSLRKANLDYEKRSTFSDSDTQSGITYCFEFYSDSSFLQIWKNLTPFIWMGDLDYQIYILRSKVHSYLSA